MAVKVTARQLDNLPGYYEFDYKNPLANQRIRRKIKASHYESQLLKDLLEQVIALNLDEEDTYNLIQKTEPFIPYSTYLMESITLVYFGYIKNSNYNMYEVEKLRKDFLDSNFALNNYDANYCFLGKAGVGKSTIIRKLSPFCENQQLPFPFTDTSRTTVFPADYCFVPQSKKYKFLVVLKPYKEIEINIKECIDRAISKMIEQKKLGLNTVENAMDDVFTSFVTDPSQSFDIRYSLGRYIKTTSPANKKTENAELIRFWRNLYFQLQDMIGLLNISTDSNNSDDTLYKVIFSDAIKDKNTDSPIYSLYKYILSLIKERVSSVRNLVIAEIESNPIIDNLKTDFDDEELPYIKCDISDITSEYFGEFIQLFTIKKSTYFGHSIFNIVNHLRIELPINKNIRTNNRENFSFVVQDTIGIAHSNDNGGSFENSTSLRTDDLDAIVLVDDSRLNGDVNISSILEHLVARMDPAKFIFAFTFFDELEKADFDEDEDISDERRNYLRSTQINTINNVIKNRNHANTLVNKLTSDDTVFMEGLMNPSDYSSISKLLDSLINITYRFKSKYHLYKKDNSKDAIIYDYRKLPLLYSSAITEYCNLQNNIYMVKPPHFKTTEALTLRLSRGIKSFFGARLLTPVDDLYNKIIVSLSDYIDTPAEINFTSSENAPTEPIVNELKSLVSEEIRKTINEKFFTPKLIEAWNSLYLDYGTGSDYRRRTGIISTENTIAPDINAYLLSTIQNHIIDSLEEAFRVSIKNIETKYDIK